MDHTATDPSPGIPDALLGVCAGPYRLRRRLGQGGMGVVYEAVHERIGQRAAVKVLPLGASRDPRAAQRLLNEALALGKVSHEGLVKVFDCGQLPQGTPYVLMEYLEGETLGARLQRLRAEGRRLRWSTNTAPTKAFHDSSGALAVGRAGRAGGGGRRGCCAPHGFAGADFHYGGSERGPGAVCVLGDEGRGRPHR